MFENLIVIVFIILAIPFAVDKVIDIIGKKSARKKLQKAIDDVYDATAAEVTELFDKLKS